jgi:DNA-binding XRE family transcriptional regulator
MIELDETRIRELKAERADLRRQKKRIEKIYKSLYGAEAQVYYLRIIRKMTQEAAADEAGFSRRHLQRIESAMRDEGLI